MRVQNYHVGIRLTSLQVSDEGAVLNDPIHLHRVSWTPQSPVGPC